MDTEEKKVEEVAQGETPEQKKTETVTPSSEEMQKKIDELERHARNKEQEAARVQKKLEAFQQAEDQRKKDEMSEVDRIKLEKTEADQRAERAEKALTDERIKNAVYAEADKAQYGEKKSRFVSPDIAYRLLDLSKIEFEDGKVTGVADLLKALAKDSPFLLEQPANGDRVGSPSGNKLKQQTETKRADVPLPRI